MYYLARKGSAKACSSTTAWMAQLNRSPADLPGGFASKLIHDKRYHYNQRKGPAGLEQIYVGPDDEATRALIEASHDETAVANQTHLRKWPTRLQPWAATPSRRSISAC